MKSKFLTIALLMAISVLQAKAQEPKKISAEDQKAIKNILGKDGAAIFKDGAVIITKPSKVSDIKVDPKSPTGFSGLKNPGSVADWVAVKKEWWVAKSAGKELEKTLGKQRFDQLQQVLDRNNIR